MDNVRNIVSCPLSGLTADEVIDTRLVAQRMQQAIVGGKRFSNLPRKFNLSVSGCREDCGHAQTHDLSFVPAGRDGAIGFNVLVGGALGGPSPEYARPLDAFVSEGDAVDLTTSILEVYRDHGLRAKRKESRLKWLLRSWGVERFREAVEARFGDQILRAGTPLSARHGGDHIGVTAQRDSDQRHGGLPGAGRPRDGRRPDRVRPAGQAIRVGRAAAHGATECADPECPC